MYLKFRRANSAENLTWYREVCPSGFSSSQNLEVIRWVTSLLSPSKNMQLCNEQIRVKVQFRGLELFRKKGTLFEEESYLAKIFRPFSLHLHTLNHVYNAFWCRIFFRKHGKSTPKDRQDRHVLIVVSWSWRHNAGARELSGSANHTLKSMTTTCRWRRWQADGLLSCWYNGGLIVKLCRQKRKNYVRMGAIRSQSYQQLVNEVLKILGG